MRHQQKSAEPNSPANLKSLPIAIVIAAALHMTALLLLMSPLAFRSDGLETTTVWNVEIMPGDQWGQTSTQTITTNAAQPPEPAKDSTIDGLSASNEQRQPISLAEALGGASSSPPVVINTADNELWRAIEPCWQKMSVGSTAPVSLQISFSPLGNLASPPVILREGGRDVDEKRLHSESLAIEALSQCGPYPMASNQMDVVVLFP